MQTDSNHGGPRLRPGAAAALDDVIASFREHNTALTAIWPRLDRNDPWSDMETISPARRRELREVLRALQADIERLDALGPRPGGELGLGLVTVEYGVERMLLVLRVAPYRLATQADRDAAFARLRVIEQERAALPPEPAWPEPNPAWELEPPPDEELDREYAAWAARDPAHDQRWELRSEQSTLEDALRQSQTTLGSYAPWRELIAERRASRSISAAALAAPPKKPGTRGDHPLDVVRDLMFHAAVEFLRNNRGCPTQKQLCEEIAAHRLRDGKGMNAKTLSRWLSDNGVTWEAEIKRALLLARRELTIDNARQRMANVSRR
jgi:hypothetical protein